ncbi:hypothetical protein RSAG8_04249, partial [Rhizoctonia solani AG-8 WAC10335]
MMSEESFNRTSLRNSPEDECSETWKKSEHVPDSRSEQDSRSEGEPSRPVSDAAIPRTRSDGDLYKLWQSHRYQFQGLGELNEIERRVDYRTSIVKLTPDGHPDLPSRLGELGAAYGNRFRLLGEPDDLEHAMEYIHRAVVSTPKDHPHLSHWLGLLGTAYLARFLHLDELKDLDKAIEYKLGALAAIPDDQPGLPRLLAELGENYETRFDRVGNLDDLDNAIEHESRSIALTPDDHHDLLRQLIELGKYHIKRFLRLEELDDLEKAIGYQSRALALAPDDDSELFAYLGDSYTFLFMHLGKQEGFERGIEYYSRALSLMPDGHPDLPTRLANLGAAYNCRFNSIGERVDVEKAIEHTCHAVSLAPDDEPELPRWHVNLSIMYNGRFEHSDEPHDLEKAIENLSRSIALTPEGDSDLPKRHFLLGESYFVRYQRTDDPSQLKNALDSFRRISHPSIGASRLKFHSAVCWALRASQHSSLYSSCIEAYHATIDLLPHVIWLSANSKEQYQDISVAKNVAKGAASAAIRCLDYKLALEWLEHTRCVIWSQNLMLRSPLDQLQASHPGLATRLQKVAKQLHDASPEFPSSPSSPSGSVTPWQTAEHRRHLAKEYNNLLIQARSLPGFEDFLRPMKANGLLRAARNGPIIVINCYKEDCDALIILPGKDDIAHVHLPNFSEKKASRAHSELERSIQQYDSDEPEAESPQEPGIKYDIGSVLATLWNDIVKPILEFLGYTNDALIGNLPHITWCPTGVLSFLPLHAAGDYDHPRARVFDYVISSYTPTLTALLASTPGSLSCDPRVLAIGQEYASSSKSLPGTTRELACVKAHMTNQAGYSQLI